LAGLLAEAMGHLGDAIAHIGGGGDRAEAAADRAVGAVTALETAYGRGMAALLAVDEREARIGGRELYRRCSRIGELVADVAERVVYAIVKES